MMKLVVLSCFLAAVSGSFLTPYTYWASPIQPYNYRGPLSLAPGQSADVLGADGRPLDTLEVNLDRAAHFNAKALDSGFHLLKKRSAAFITTPFATPVAAAYGASFPLAYSAPLWQPYNYRGPLSLAPGQPANILGADGRPLDTLEVNQDRAAHIAAKSGLHILKKRSAVIAPVSNIAIAHSAVIPSAYSYTYPASYATPLSPLAYSAYGRLAYTAAPYAPLAYSYSAAPFASFLKK